MSEISWGIILTLLAFFVIMMVGAAMVDVRTATITDSCESMEMFRIDEKVYDCTLRVEE